MRTIQILILLFIFSLLSCAKEKASEEDTLKVVELYSEEDFKTKIQIIDTVCLNDSLRAMKDFKNGNATLVVDRFLKSKYYFFFDTLFRKDLTYELAKFKIKPDFDVSYPTCIPLMDNRMFKINCYQSTLESEILKRYKYDLIDSIKTVIESKFVLRKSNEVFAFLNRDQPRYDDPYGEDPADDYLRKLSMDLESKFKYPKEYHANTTKDKGSSYSTARFILMKDGVIKNLTIETKFHDSLNKKFKSYFEKQISDFIRGQKKWVRPTYAGVTVNNGMEFLFFYK